ncbi:cytochrome P450 2U1-like [Folsomia candida]|uniref:cytochrome P450 2U1-like n=1 Tax=Folsomia candida TaxID=158441 RepID=UPI00160551DC|nr:cytochrome P450 2U1-like [Folsomia candida]
MADMNSLFSNPRIFQDPLSFNPERFIDPNGSLVNDKLVIPFSVGKRGCPGELFADVTAFLMAMNLIKKYKLSTVPGEPKPKLAMHIGLTSCPHEFSMLMTKRQ